MVVRRMYVRQSRLSTEHLQHLAFTSKKIYEEFLIKILQSLFNNMRCISSDFYWLIIDHVPVGQLTN